MLRELQVLSLSFHPFINTLSPIPLLPSSLFSLQASQLGVYKAFVDNYKVALETAEKCSQSNNQFQKISEVGSSLHSHPYESGLCGLPRAF